MAKDPAFLFYPGDWLGGTMTMSRHQKGCYMDLLIAQFNNGPLSLDTIKTVLGQDQAHWAVLSSKFKQTADGLWFNERLATEIEKRKNFCDSRRNNKSGRKKTYDKTYDYTHDKSHDLHMENENENRNEIKDSLKGGVGENFLIPSMSEVFTRYLPNYLPDRDRDFPALFSIAEFLLKSARISGPVEFHVERVIEAWEPVCAWVAQDSFYSQKPLSTISNGIQEIVQKTLYGDKTKSRHQRRGPAISDDKLKDAIAQRLGEKR